MTANILRALAFIALAFVTASQAAARQVVEVAFVLDTTGSMGPLIEGAKRKIWSIATAIVDANPDAEIRLGLVAYRDIGDQYVTKTFDLTTDIQDLYGKLLQLRAQAGGDWPESVNEALHVAVNTLTWTQGGEICRIMFLVGDAPPHMDYRQDIKYPEVIRMARDRDIVVNTVQAGRARDTERIWRDIAQRGHGQYIPIPQDGGRIVIIETPYDTEIIELQGRINGTVIPYGSRRQRASVEDKARQLKSAPAPVASEMAGYLSRQNGKAGGTRAITGDGDLTADVATARQKLDAVKDDDFPDELRRMSTAEREVFVDKQIAQRKALNEQLSNLVKRRDQYTLDQRNKAPKPAGDSFDRAVEETLRAQIRR